MKLKPFELFDQNANTSYKLEILEIPKSLITQDDIEDFFADYICGSEKMNFLETTYGVHDVSGDDKVMFCFTSYEWDKSNLDKLKEYWSTWLTSLNFKTGSWK